MSRASRAAKIGQTCFPRDWSPISSLASLCNRSCHREICQSVKTRASTIRSEKLCEDRKGDFDSMSSYRLGLEESPSVKSRRRSSERYSIVYRNPSGSRQGLRRLYVYWRIKADFQKSRTRVLGCGYVDLKAKLHLVPVISHPDQLVSHRSHPVTWFIRTVPVL